MNFLAKTNSRLKRISLRAASSYATKTTLKSVNLVEDKRYVRKFESL